MNQNSVKILAYSNTSTSARALSEGLGVRRLKREGSRYTPTEGHVLINWGLKKLPPQYECMAVLNHPSYIPNNKLQFFQQYSQFCPPFTTNRDEAQGWIDTGQRVVCRTVLNGHSGEGIIIAATNEEMVDAPLYVRYIPKELEFRCHFTPFGRLFWQEKRASHSVAREDRNYAVRNHANGFIYAHNDMRRIPDVVHNKIKDFLTDTSIDFGAVDVIYNNRNNSAYILEVNMSPGLEGATLEHYIESFQFSIDRIQAINKGEYSIE